MSVKVTVSNISKTSLHDGPGIRTVVYLKGCPLRCKWCHNPETFRAKPDILYNESKCIKCARCVNLCPQNHIIAQDKMVFLRDDCSLCGKCTDECPTGALSLCGKEMDAEEVFKEVKKDIHYFTQSGGGITLSGGECLLYPEFCKELLEKCKNENIHTAIESALYVPLQNIKAVLPYVDLFFADLKIPSSSKHKEFCGKGNELIIENIRYISQNAKNVIVRIPLIPGVNDSENDMDEFSKLINNFSQRVCSVELLKYNYLAESKYKFLDYDYCAFAKESQSEKHLERLRLRLCQKLKRKIPVVYEI